MTTSDEARMRSRDAVVQYLQESHDALNSLLGQSRGLRQMQEREAAVNKLCTRINNLITERQELIYSGIDSRTLVEVGALNRHAQQLISELHGLTPGELAWEAKAFALESYVRTLMERERALFLEGDSRIDMEAVCKHFERQRQELHKRDKVVEKSSKDSFPASDPPASQQFDIPDNSLSR